MLVNKVIVLIRSDPAVEWYLTARVAQAVAGVVTLLLVATYLSADAQGFYYTFFSLIALQVFIELALFQVIITFSSHEWARLALDAGGSISGDAVALSRLRGLVRFCVKWYFVVSTIFIVAIGGLGWVFLSGGDNSGISWKGPWIVIVILSAINLWSLPALSLLEGCDQVAGVNRFRAQQSVIANAAQWGVLLLGGDLWAAPAMIAANVMCLLYLACWKYRRFFADVLLHVPTASMQWSTELLPMQWRLAALSLVNYFMYYVFTPVMFHYHGAVLAGQMGMTLQIVTFLSWTAFAWVQSAIPKFGQHVARGDLSGLDVLWTRRVRITLTVYLLGAAFVWVLGCALVLFEHPIAERLLPLGSFAILLTAAFVMLGIQCCAVYLRSFKQEPLVWVGVGGSLLSGSLVWGLGSTFGAAGAAGGYLMALLTILPFVIYVWRSHKHIVHVQASSQRR